MKAAKSPLAGMHFIFTEHGFFPDIVSVTNPEDQQVWKKGGGYPALYEAALLECPKGADASVVFLYRAAESFFRSLTDLPELELVRENAQADELLNAAPFVIGSEYPFAFLATYATKTEDGSVRHVPLKYALTEYSGQREKLLALLSCLNRAAEVSSLIAGFMENGELFHPLRLTADEAYLFLKQIEDIERTGILCRIPNWWRKRSSSVSMTLSLGDKKPSLLGFDTLVSVQPKLVADGVTLTKTDVRRLLAQTEGLAFLKGKWIEVDHDRLRKLLKEMESGSRDITLIEALQMQMDTQKKKQLLRLRYTRFCARTSKPDMHG